MHAPCTNCLRHLRVHETACPFCGSAVTLPATVPAALVGRATRAAIYAFTTSLVVTACSSGSTTSTSSSSTSASSGGPQDPGGMGADYGAPPIFEDAGDAALSNDAGKAGD